jgi:hypothetical protein
MDKLSCIRSKYNILFLGGIGMREEFFFNTLFVGRMGLSESVGRCPLDKRNVVPAGFTTSIHWQLGHIATVTQELVFEKSGNEPTLPAEFTAFFKYGTRPSEWTEEPPAWDDILFQLKYQSNQIRSIFAGKLDVKIMPNPFKGETVEELLLFNFFHETIHIGNTLAMLKGFGVKGVGV